ncbi:MAG: nucleoside triphosphate pyrophosphohydrolase family protein [Meiothermus sp.]|nr:nucleoside triphosphate pyrophosphohydrolase family protein [Meiothermus sp.]
MRLNEYQEQALKTAIYPKVGGLGLLYTVLKLAGEAGEVSEKVGKVIRDDMKDASSLITGLPLRQEVREALRKELGDVLWYVAATAYELGYSLEEVALVNQAKLRDRAERGVLQGSGDNR